MTHPYDPVEASRRLGPPCEGEVAWAREDREDRAFEMAGVCGDCSGEGEVRWLANPPDPQTEVSGRCSRCHGEGVA